MRDTRFSVLRFSVLGSPRGHSVLGSSPLCYNDSSLCNRSVSSCIREHPMRRPSLRWQPSPRQPDDDTERGARTSIARRLRWTLLLSSVVPLLIVGVLLIGLNAGAQQRSVYDDQIDLATRV